MTLSRDHLVDEALLERLLARQAREQQASLLEQEGLLDQPGLDRLLDLADGLSDSDPDRACRLADLCARMANQAGAPVARPRADYVRLKALAENGEFDAALSMARSAHDGYVALGLNLEALRTHVGRMWVLLELGRYEEALDTGQKVLHALVGGEGSLDVTAEAHERDLLTALVHQNRGICYEYMGRYDRALDAYAVAEEHYQALGETRRVGEILDNRGGVLLRLGRGKEALAAHEAAAEIFERAGLTLAYAGALENIGEAHLRLADYVRGLDTLERARLLFDSLGALAGEHLLLLDIADAYLELNLFSEALAAYGEVNERLRNAEGVEGALPHERAQTLWGMGSALIALSDLKEAGRALRGAADKFAAAGNAPMLSGVMLEQASLLAARGDKEGALSAARRALGIVSERDYPVQRVYAHLRLSDLLLPDHQEETEQHLLAAQRLAHSLALPHLRFRLDERLGRLRRLQGRDEEARVLLEAAVNEIERLRGTVAHEAMRASFLRDKTAAYEDLLLLYLARDGEDGAQRAFEVAEKAKSRALTDLITGVVERAPGTTTDPTRDRRLRDLQADLNATYNQMLGVDGEELEVPTQSLQDRAVELEAEISRLGLQATPASDPFLTPNASEDDGLEGIPSDTTLLAYHVVGDEILAFVGARDDVSVVRNLGSVQVVSRLLQHLGVQWDRFRADSEFVARHAAILERSTREILGQLYTALVAPLEPLLERARRGASKTPGVPPKLAVVPHGPLHQVPFHALLDGERYLIERFEISYAPSARVYALCQQRGRRNPEEVLVVSVPDPLIPAVTEEARTVARHFPNAEVLEHEEATTAAVRDRSSGRAVLHLACHGFFRPDNPMFSSLRLHDGWLTAADVMQLDLAGALVTLSACESGRSEVVGGDEILGLTRAFLGAGASTLVASLWLVQDETTASLMERYYERLRADSRPAEALRAAQLALKTRCPHPYYWAPFVLLGQG